MAANIEVLGVSLSGKVVRRYDPDADRTTLALSDAQVRELFDALGPVLKFFEDQK